MFTVSLWNKFLTVIVHMFVSSEILYIMTLLENYVARRNFVLDFLWYLVSVSRWCILQLNGA
jgi:hypothetical protein